MTEISAEVLASALKRCEIEAIQYIGQIQSHGALITISLDEIPLILRCSDNIQHFFSTHPEQILGFPLAVLIGDDQAREVVKLVQDCQSQTKASTLIYAVVEENILELQTTAHLTQEEAVIEFEPIRTPYQPSEMLKLFESVRLGMNNFLSESDLESCCQYFTDLVRSIAGFERVMLYRFDESWDGEVIAESKRPEETFSYLGHRFPAGDIPPQARALYTKNTLRFVMDAQEPPSQLISVNGLDSPLDMTYAILRTFSPVHVQYLSNMGVRASLSVSIVVQGKLWGLIACHSSQPHFVSHPIRNILEFIGGMIALRNSAFENIRNAKLSSQLDELISRITRDIYNNDDTWLPLHLNQDRVLKLADAETFVVNFENQQFILGRPISSNAALRIGELLTQLPKSGMLVTDRLCDHTDLPIEDRRHAAGILAFRIGNTDHSCAWLRPEKVIQVKWAGSPSKEVSIDDQGIAKICPRKSFETWTEVWHERSTPWEKGLLDITEVFARSLIESLSQRSLKQRDEFHRIFQDNSLELHSKHYLDGTFMNSPHGSRLLLGKSTGELIGTSLSNLAIPEDTAYVIQSIAKLQTQNSVTMTYRGLIEERICWLETTLKIAHTEQSPPEVLAVTKDVTEQQNFRKAVEDYQQQNQQVIHSSAEGVMAVDPQGAIIYANTIAAELLGWSIEELVGKHAHETIHYQYPDGSPFPTSACQTTLALESGQPYVRHDDVYFRKDGSAIKVVATTTAVIENEIITGAIILFVSADSNDALSPLVPHHHAGAVMTLDQAGLITSYSEDLSRITGYADSEIIGKPASILNSNVHTHCFFRSMWEALRQDGHWRGVVWNRCKDGSVRPFWVSMNAVSNAAGQVIQHIAIYGEADPKNSPEAQMMFLATHDRLTSLPNRNEFARSLRQAIARASRRKTKIVVGFIDMDHFKDINDHYGHGVGDRFLTEIARRLMACCREEDTVARWGGDEFVFLMGDVESHEAPLTLANRVLETLCQPVEIDSLTLQSSASIGISIYPDDSSSTGTLIQFADKSMYHAKQSGRNQIATLGHLIGGQAAAST